MEPMLFGQILLNFHLITEKELNHCLHIQNHIDFPKPLGKILLEKGLIDLTMLSTILTVQKRELDDGVAELGLTTHQVEHRLRNADARSYLSLARDINASSLYLTTGKKPMVRLHGCLTDLPMEPLDAATCEKLVFELLTQEQRACYDVERRLDLDVSVPEAGRFRLNVFRHQAGIGAVIRIIRDQIRSLDELELPESVRRLTRHRHGLILVTGATGSGKTTTLGALVNEINVNQNRHIVTFDESIEFVFESDKSLVTQRQVGTHTASFVEGLRCALREDPDVIVVSNLCDPDTFSLALTAAETGHLVIGALHTRSTHSTIVRVIDQYPTSRRPHARTTLAGSLRGVICQELIPTVRGGARVLASEVMIVNSTISNLIREDRAWQIPNAMKTTGTDGMTLMDDELDRLVRSERITIEEAVELATDRSRFLVPA
jgi:twitching motility protein PilT